MLSLRRFALPFLLALAAAPALAAPPMPPPAACDYSKGACWRPAVNARWQYQLTPAENMAATGNIDTSVSAKPYSGAGVVKPEVFNFDLYHSDGRTPNAKAVQAVHAAGGKAICYVSAGTWEKWRPDAAAFPAAVKGRKNGWPGEQWLDIRDTAVLMPIMRARLQKCVQAGFDGVEWDNVDGYANRTGFPLKEADQLYFNAMLANMTHQAGLTVALKNTVELVPQLAPYFDYAVNEECQAYNECGVYTDAFVQQAKAVFQVEYSGTMASICKANAANRNAIKKDLDLHATPYAVCR